MKTYTDWMTSWKAPVLDTAPGIQANVNNWAVLNDLDEQLFLEARRLTRVLPRLTCRAAVKLALEARAVKT